jgi:tetratricopeptide (TPR) repeat protein
MKRCFLTLALFLFASSVVAQEPAPKAVAEAPQQSVDELIQQLGSDQYAQRRRAEEELMRLGPSIHDQLKLAEQNDDLEIAERAKYILQSMRVEWIQPQDSQEVRRALSRFGDLSADEKESRIRVLSELPKGQGLPALCRIARLDHVPKISRKAAIALLDVKLTPEERQAVVEACRQELQTIDRPATEWIAIWMREQPDRKATLADWNKAIEAQQKLLKEEAPDTDYYTVYALLQRRLEICDELKLTNETTNALLAVVDFTGGEGDRRQFNASMVQAFQWLVDHQRWDVLNQVYETYRGKIHGDRSLLYYYAAALAKAALAKAGNADEANKLADRAFEMKPDSEFERLVIAERLAALGSVDWAMRDYRAAIDALPATDFESLYARRELATWLHDRQEFKAASDVLAEFFVAIQAKENRAARKTLLQQIDGQGYLNLLEGRQLLYLANHQHARGEYDSERETLETAYEKSEDDPDVLIAMSRLPNVDDAYKQQVRDRITKMSDRYLSLIEQMPEDPSKYNQWAWLISNTEQNAADYQRAVQHSLRSLELSPEEPSYLDTLGRCYFSAGDVENAIKSQQKAVELAPQYQIMRRQLAEFEKAKK